MTRIERQAALIAAQQLRALLVQFGANSNDISVETAGDGAQLRGRRSAGVQAEFGSRARTGMRRMGRAIEALRQGRGA
jgi:hypothetical protein